MRRRRLKSKRQEIVSVESRINVYESPHTHDEQPGPDKQHGRQSSFADDECITQPALPSRGARILCQFGMKICFSASQRWGESECNACNHRQKEREHQYRYVDMETIEERHAVTNAGWDTRDEQHHREACHGTCCRTRDQRQQHVFNQKLPGNAASRSPDRAAHGNFTRASCGFGKLNIGDIRTRDEQYASGCTEKQQEHGPDLSHNGIVQRLKVSREVAIRQWIRCS